MKKYKFNRKLITINCDCCGVSFEKPLSEYNRNSLLNRSNYCSRSCFGKCNNKNNLNKGNHSNLISNNKCDGFTPFRYYYRNCSKRLQNFDLTLQYLKDLWETQKGICPYTGISLQLATYLKNHNNPIYTASLDRIDPNKGYVIGNVVFVSTCANYMKNVLSLEDMLKYLSIISDNFLSGRTISSSLDLQKMLGALAGN